MTHKNINKSTKRAYLFSFLFFLLPFLLAPFLLWQRDSLRFIVWSFVFIGFALLAYPLCRRLFPYSPDQGFAYSFLLGLLLPSFCLWTLSYLSLPFFTVWGSRILSLLCFAIIYGVFAFKKARSQRNRKLEQNTLEDSQKETILGYFRPIHFMETGLFLLAFLLWTYVRSHKPEIYDLEKFMDYGFMMTMWRGDSLPAQDMWMAGKSINYYYFGQYLFTFISKLSNIHPQYTYNLSVAMSFALSFLLSFAVIRDLLFYYSSSKYEKLYQAKDLDFIGVQEKSDFWKTIQTTIIPHGSGILAAILLCLGGNSHAFFYKPGQLGNRILRFLERSGMEFGKLSGFFFSDSTRFIGYNPESTDKTIHEFPYYSYLVADLHAHMINHSIVLLFLALAFSFYLVYLRDNKETFLAKDLLLSKHAILLGGLLGIFAMANYWDFVIYFVVITLLLTLLGIQKKIANAKPLQILLFVLSTIALFAIFLLITHPLLQALAFTALFLLALFWNLKNKALYSMLASSMAFFFTLAHWTSLLFNIYLDPMSKNLRFTNAKSGLYSLFILWFSQVAVALLFCICLWVFNPKEEGSFFSHFLKQNPSALFILLLIFCAFGLILAPEVLYVEDIYGGAFQRANTMFKFTYQSFSMLALVQAFTLGYLLHRLLPKFLVEDIASRGKEKQEFFLPRKYQGVRIENNLSNIRVSTIVPIVLCLCFLTIPFSYTPSIFDWYGDLQLQDSLGLEASAYYGKQNTVDLEGQEVSLADRMEIIHYFNDEVEGQVNVLEAFGDSYSVYNSISAFTGMPTIIGWQTHEWLWRSSSNTEDAYLEYVYPLQEEVTNIYEAKDTATAKALLEKYSISYLVVSELERIKFKAINDDVLKGLGEIVFSPSEEHYVIKIEA